MAIPDDKTKWDLELDEHLLQDLYAWIDQVPLSRSKRRIERDFSDGGNPNFTVAIQILAISTPFCLKIYRKTRPCLIPKLK